LHFLSISLAVNFINILPALFLDKIFGAKISNPKASFVVFGAKILYEKCTHKMLMKLTLEIFLFLFYFHLSFYFAFLYPFVSLTINESVFLSNYPNNASLFITFLNLSLSICLYFSPIPCPSISLFYSVIVSIYLFPIILCFFDYFSLFIPYIFELFPANFVADKRLLELREWIFVSSKCDKS